MDTDTFKGKVKSMLPDSVVSMLKKLLAKSEKPPALDLWLEHMNLLVNRDILPKIPENTSESKQLALFWVPQIDTPHMYLEFMIGMALQLRGWDTIFAVCDSDLPHCPYENAHSKRPTCEDCRKQSTKIIETFHLPYIKLSSYIRNTEINDICDDICNTRFADLVATKHQDYEIGKISNELLNYYYFGVVEPNGNEEVNRTFRRIYAGNLISFLFAERLQNEFKPDVVLMLNGQAFHTQAGFYSFRENGIRVVTWDGYPPYEDSFIFSQDTPSVLGYIDHDIWIQESIKSLSEREEAQVNAFLDRWKRGSIGDIQYHPSPETSVDPLRERLGILPNKKTFIAFTNVIWDSACLGRDVGFHGIMDWIFSLITWFSTNQSTHQLIIRIHPAEKRLPEWAQTDLGMEQCIRKRFPFLPSNIIIVGPEDNAFSYTLADLADAIGVYTTSLGYELAAQGKRVWVAGAVHYREHGFTEDIRDKSHLYELLDSNWNGKLSSEEIELAKKYIYIRFFRQIVRIPFLYREKIVYATRPFFKNLHFLGAKNDPLFGALVDKIVDGSPFIDIPVETNSEWKDVRI